MYRNIYSHAYMYKSAMYVGHKYIYVFLHAIG